MLNSKEADFILKGDGEVIYPEIAKDELELYYDVKGKKNGDVHKDKLLDMSGQGKDGELSGFDYDGELSGYDGDNGLVFDGIEDTLKMPKLDDIDATNLTYQLNNNILAFTEDEVKTVKNGEVEVGGRNLVIKTGSLEGYYLEGEWRNHEFALTPKDFIKVDPGSTYTMSVPRSKWADNIVRMVMWDENKDFVVRNNYGGGNPTRIHTITIPNNVHYITPGYGKDIDIKIEKGNTATPYMPAPEDLIETTELRGNILGDMEDIVDASPRDRQSGKEVFTEHADDSHVHVDVDGKSYQHAGSGKNLFVPVRLEANYSIKENNKLINTIGSEIFYPIESPVGAYTASFSYQYNLNYAPIFMTFYYSDGSSDGDSHGYLDSTSQTRKEMTSNSAKKVVGVGYNAPTVIGVEWDTNPDPEMTRYGLALDAGIKTIGVIWDMEPNPNMVRSGGLI